VRSAHTHVAIESDKQCKIDSTRHRCLGDGEKEACDRH
jgi:hypothetical protein